jgi:WG repeat protein
MMRIAYAALQLILIVVTVATAGCTSSTTTEQKGGTPVAAFRDEQGKYGFIDREGVVVLAPKYEWAREFVNGLALVRLDRSLGFIDASGSLKVTLPPDTENALDASDGLIWFQSKEKGWGLTVQRGLPDSR